MTDLKPMDDNAEQAPIPTGIPENPASPDRREFIRLAGLAGGLSSFSIISSCARNFGSASRSTSEVVDPEGRTVPGYDIFFLIDAAADNLSVDGNPPDEAKIYTMMDKEIGRWADSIDPVDGSHDLKWYKRHIHPHSENYGDIDEGIFFGTISIDTTEMIEKDKLARGGGKTEPGKYIVRGFGVHMKQLLKNLGQNNVTEMDLPSKDESDNILGMGIKNDVGNLCRIWIEETNFRTINGKQKLIKLSHTGEPTC